MANKLISIVPSGTNNYLTPSLSLNRLATDSVSPGVVGAITNTSGVAPATGAFAVNAQGSPNMTVAVTGGVAYLSATPTGGTAQTFGVTMDAAENVTIAANASGSTVYDFIYLQADATALNNPSSTALNVVTLITSRSTTPYSAGGANYGNSNGAIANSLLIAVVTVANGAASIANASITDARVVCTDTMVAGTNTVTNASLQANTAWTSYSPTWTSGGTAPVLNNGTLTGKYQQIGKVVFFRISFTAGSTTTFGTGEYAFGLPTTSNEAFGGYQPSMGTWTATNAAATWGGIVAATSATKVALLNHSVSGIGAQASTVTNAAPTTWASGGTLTIKGFYETV